jgi:hypothetical protein
MNFNVAIVRLNLAEHIFTMFTLILSRFSLEKQETHDGVPPNRKVGFFIYITLETVVPAPSQKTMCQDLYSIKFSQ